MIQRIQSLYLLLTALLCACMFVLPLSYYHIKRSDGEVMLASTVLSVKTTDGEVIQSTWPVAILTAVVCLLALVTIFLFSKRPRQIFLSRVLLLLLVILLAAVYFYFEWMVRAYAGNTAVSSTYWLGSFCPMVAIVLVSLALRGISKDEELVRSADRLR